MPARASVLTRDGSQPCAAAKLSAQVSNLEFSWAKTRRVCQFPQRTLVREAGLEPA